MNTKQIHIQFRELCPVSSKIKRIIRHKYYLYSTFIDSDILGNFKKYAYSIALFSTNPLIYNSIWQRDRYRLNKTCCQGKVYHICTIFSSHQPHTYLFKRIFRCFRGETEHSNHFQSIGKRFFYQNQPKPQNRYFSHNFGKIGPRTPLINCHTHRNTYSLPYLTP